jgi:hypothetical protein
MSLYDSPGVELQPDCKRSAEIIMHQVDCCFHQAALAHLGERQTEVHLSPALHAISGGTVFDPQKRHCFCFLSGQNIHVQFHFGHST